MSKSTTVCNCGHPAQPSDNSPSGYGIHEGKTICPACVATLERVQMVASGEATLYVEGLMQPNRRPTEIADWLGGLRFPVITFTAGTTGIYGVLAPRHDIWFIGPEGAIWHARHQGDENTAARCRRTQRKEIYLPRERRTYRVPDSVVEFVADAVAEPQQ